MLFVLTGSTPDALHHLPRRQMTFQFLDRACRRIGIDMVLTTPERLDSVRGICHGWSLDDTEQQEWKPRQCHLAGGVVWDAMYLADLKAHKVAYRRLVDKLPALGVVMFNPKFPAKDELNVLIQSVEVEMQAPISQSLLPQTHVNVDADDVVRLLKDTNGRVWFKPVYGSGGRNMLLISRVGNELYQVQGERFYRRHVAEQWTKRQLVRQLQKALEKRPYMLQHDVQLIQTPDGRKVDFRVTLVRGRFGNWRKTAMTARFGKSGHSLTNYHAGGSIQSLTVMNPEVRETLTSLNLTEADLGRIANAAIKAAEVISARYNTVGMLGIDVGISSDDGCAYVYDFNSRPGRDILTDREVDVTMNQVARFACYLLNTVESRVLH
ncbi:YheC/YheD family protein [Alicyclobacillus dauci]|uniref:YheC/YheD family protein n=1 Tax=Alicyclobacillus dauci TaxID=1475485 RepID=A0ABY6YZ58_9BACL|nr:YheC/YheD family protein [Alicyclobacillus dauci]WAH35800.1 YheC/YheD family protein [Alicyclobacillus dauci]